MPQPPPRRSISCPDCDPHRDRTSPSRRDVIKSAALTAAAFATAGAALHTITVTDRAFAAAPAAASSPETLVATLYKTLTAEQQKKICFPFDHKLRSEINNNWFITDSPIKDLLKPDQLDLVRQIFLGLHTEEYAQKVVQQVEHDNESDGGFGRCAIALFGNPGDVSSAGSPDSPPQSKFEFVFTGRHVTRRCDGNSVAGAAFGGPIFYGHAAESFNEKPDHPGNIYWYQAKRANEVFNALDGKQRKLALRQDPRPEQKAKTVALRGTTQGIAGLPVGDMSSDQKDLVRKVMADLLAPFRKTDADETMNLIEAAGFDNLHLSFFNNKGMDIGNDGVWDVWQVEGPAMVWYFRGAPHVHTWVHVRDPKQTPMAKA